MSVKIGEGSIYSHLYEKSVGDFQFLFGHHFEDPIQPDESMKKALDKYRISKEDNTKVDPVGIITFGDPFIMNDHNNFQKWAITREEFG
jgi:hypothetical protein